MASVHPVFPVFMLKKCIGDTVSILPIEGLGVIDKLSYEEVSFQIIARQVNNLWNKVVFSVKVLWKNHLVEGATLEANTNKKSRYPHIIDN